MWGQFRRTSGLSSTSLANIWSSATAALLSAPTQRSATRLMIQCSCCTRCVFAAGLKASARDRVAIPMAHVMGSSHQRAHCTLIVISILTLLSTASTFQVRQCLHARHEEQRQIGGLQ